MVGRIFFLKIEALVLNNRLLDPGILSVYKLTEGLEDDSTQGVFLYFRSRRVLN